MAKRDDDERSGPARRALRDQLVSDALREDYRALEILLAGYPETLPWAALLAWRNGKLGEAASRVYAMESGASVHRVASIIIAAMSQGDPLRRQLDPADLGDIEEIVEQIALVDVALLPGKRQIQRIVDGFRQFGI